MKKGSKLTYLFLAAAFLFSARHAAAEHEIGEVDTAFKMFGPNHKIKIVSFQDPSVQGISCFLSRAVAGGVFGALGVASEKSEASVSCRQTGPIEVINKIPDNKNGEEIFNESRSAAFKELHVSRFYDKKTGTFVYLTHSDALIEGSAKNSISVVTPQELIDGKPVRGADLLPKFVPERPKGP